MHGLRKILLFFLLFPLPLLAKAPIDELISGNNQFAFRFYETTFEEDENNFFSPFSIYSCFSMVYAGADNNTKDELQTLFHYPSSCVSLSSGYKKLLESISMPESSLTIETANSIWIEKSYPIKDSFLTLMQEGFQSDIMRQNFIQKPELSTSNINNWVKEKTHGKIPSLFPLRSITPFTRMVLANAIYLKAKFAIPFSEEATQLKPFHSASDLSESVPTMHQTKFLPYFENESIQALMIPFENSSFTTLFILPNHSDLKSIASELKKLDFISWIHSFKREKVHVEIPKCHLSPVSYDLRPIFERLGVIEPFQPWADFSQMDSDNSLFLSDAFHKATLSLDEKGVEASAATGAVMSCQCALHPRIIDFIANRPFVIMIVDKETGVILFMGDIKKMEKE